MIKVLTDLVSVRARFLLCGQMSMSSCGGRGKWAFWGLFCKALIPVIRALPSWPSHLPRAPLPNTSILGIRFQHANLGEHKHSIYSRDPHPPDLRPLPVRGLLGSGRHSRRWVAGELVKLRLPLLIAPHHSHYQMNHPTIARPPSQWKICFPQNWFLVPKMLGTADL